MKNEKTTNKINKLAKNLEGFTADNRGNLLDIKNGFAVSIKDFGENLSGLIEYAQEKNTFVGFWKDAETDKKYFDAVLIFEDLEKAIEAANKTEQIAIWNFSESAEIRLR